MAEELNKTQEQVVEEEQTQKLSKLIIHLSSGQTMEVICRDWEFRYNDNHTEFTGYNFTDLKYPDFVAIIPQHIIGISVFDCDEKELKFYKRRTY